MSLHQISPDPYNAQMALIRFAYANPEANVILLHELSTGLFHALDSDEYDKYVASVGLTSAGVILSVSWPIIRSLVMYTTDWLLAGAPKQ